MNIKEIELAIQQTKDAKEETEKSFNKKIEKLERLRIETTDKIYDLSRYNEKMLDSITLLDKDFNIIIKLESSYRSFCGVIDNKLVYESDNSRGIFTYIKEEGKYCIYDHYCPSNCKILEVYCFCDVIVNDYWVYNGKNAHTMKTISDYHLD